MLAAKALSQGRVPGRSALLAVTNLPLFIPEIVLGIALLLLVTTVGVPLSLVSVTIGHLLICLPFALAVLMARFEGFDASLEEASRDLGENGWMTFWRVTFPLVLPGIVSSLLLTLHRLVRRLHDRLLPERHGGNASRLHLGRAALPCAAAESAGLGRRHPRRLGAR